VGVDLVCFDAEDIGTPQWSADADDAASWAIGAQHFANHLPLSKPRYAVLLDMVGAQGATFYKEGMSLKYAPDIVDKVWSMAKAAGAASMFSKSEGAYVTDDHVPLNQAAGIPTIDIIPYYPDCQQSSFGPTWHTLADDVDHIDANVLRAVGQTMVQLLYSE